MMAFQDYKIDGDSITISKKELQEAYEHFRKVANKYKLSGNQDLDVRYSFYLGKAAILRDMLKMFEPIDFI